MNNQTSQSNPAKDVVKVDGKALYGAVSCKRPTNATVSEKYNRKSIATINCTLPIVGIGALVDVTIWGALETKGGDTEIVFSASVPRGMGFPDESDKDRFLGHVESAAAAWPGFELATQAATDKLLGRKETGTAVRPRLVKAVKAA